VASPDCPLPLVASARSSRQTKLVGGSIRKDEPEHEDDLRPEYKRSDFGELVRGKYVERLKTGSSVVVLDSQ